MKDQNLKDMWKNIYQYLPAEEVGASNIEQFIESRSGSIESRIRNLFNLDLAGKIVSGLFLILNIVFYKGNQDIIIIAAAGIMFLVIMVLIEYRLLQQFRRISDMGQSTKEVLSTMMIFLKRNINLIVLCMASTQVLIFVPGLLLYIYLVYGYMKTMTALSFFVFTVLALIGTIIAAANNNSQMKFHIKQMGVCLSDLNEETMVVVAGKIESERRKDHLIKLLTGLVLILGFVLILALLKTILV
jgi:hypothetical protein